MVDLIDLTDEELYSAYKCLKRMNEITFDVMKEEINLDDIMNDISKEIKSIGNSLVNQAKHG